MSPMLSNVQVARIVKAQVAQSPSHSKSKLPKLPKVQVVYKYKMLNTYGSLKAKYIYGPTMAINIYDPPMDKSTFRSHYSQILEIFNIIPRNLLFLIISLLNGNHCTLVH